MAIDERKFASALRRKYSSPSRFVRALGLDPRGLAMDEEPEERAESGGSGVAGFLRLIAKMSREDWVKLYDELNAAEANDRRARDAESESGIEGAEAQRRREMARSTNLQAGGSRASAVENGLPRNGIERQAQDSRFAFDRAHREVPRVPGHFRVGAR